MKKKFFSIFICLSILSTSFVYANSFWPECGVLGLGAATGLYGLNMVAKSGGKDGNSVKGILGLLIACGGGTMMVKGPAYIRSKNQGWIQRGLQYPLCKSKALEEFPRLIKREKNTVMKLALQAYQVCLTYAPSEMIPLHPELYNN